jgi:hypothetical protein
MTSTYHSLRCCAYLFHASLASSSSCIPVNRGRAAFYLAACVVVQGRKGPNLGATDIQLTPHDGLQACTAKAVVRGAWWSTAPHSLWGRVRPVEGDGGPRIWQQ